MKNKKRKLTKDLMSLSALPIFIFGLVVILMTSGVIYSSLRKEVRYSLNVLVHSSYQTCELKYPGDYYEVNSTVMKGRQSMKGCFDLVDNVKELSGADATFFYGGRRYLTTIRNPDGSRALGTEAASEVVETVLEEGQEYFSDHVLVNGTKYFGYYMPVENSDGNIVGMMFIGKTRSEVMEKIRRNIIVLCLLAVSAMGIAIAVSIFYSKKIIYSLNKTEKFLGEIAGGNLMAEIDPYILERHDEIGEMGRFSVMLQNSISELVGKDPLTGLYNRRSCNAVMDNILIRSQKKKKEFSVAMGDIDHFKRVNDTYGHQAGDKVLKEIAVVLQRHMEHLGFVFRWGGEEFLIVYEDMEQQEVLGHLKELKDCIAETKLLWEGDTIGVTMTFGITACNGEIEFQELIQRADENLYRGKQEGRNRIVSCYASQKESTVIQ